DPPPPPRPPAPDPGEVEHDEREALGPVKRNREAPADAEADDDLFAGGLAYDQADDEGWTDEDDVERDAAPRVQDPPPLEFDSDRSRRAEPEPALEEPAFESPELPADRRQSPPPAEHQPPPAPAPGVAHGSGAETAEYDVEGPLAADEPGEDMLEETPEFLQDTPDHDRLWFEQRPPRDFDFDS
ncbi:MAG: hypothetical protein ACR2NR_20920, partial [Solirubrobacteraceae bacterium]